MNRSIIFKVIMALVLLGALVGIGIFAYNAGLAQGMAVNLQPPAGGSGTLPPPYPYYAFAAWLPVLRVRRVWLLRRADPPVPAVPGLRRLPWLILARPTPLAHASYGPWGTPPSGEAGPDIPPMVAEWHRRMHEQPPETKAE